ncbi:DUF6624 domain-containing protein [Verrucosispora sp. WMMD573]|uniref:DUF6624 domain-containing protein n=1 Tax=Verrucosispora sp. WMMD573 TaxID=3015149 RepID=UPI00248B1C11|nr:DUF6624 domain-containing protein [Verrucosispora sp. WMMD573]WBB53841.1 hypothetical protein O7601_25305 [Verrucosispora sp. WMMD573]
MDDELRCELLALANEDQRVRNSVSVRAGPGGEIPDDLAREWARVDERNAARLAEIVSEHGWPTRSLVGDDGANAAWLLAQHADRSPDEQQRFLDLMRAAVAANDASAVDLAYLTDRVAIHAGQPQIYGTQLRRDPKGRLTAYPIASPDTVDQRRAALGLCPLVDYIAAVGQR